MTDRRRFLTLAGAGGFTAALCTAAAGGLYSDAAFAVTAREQRRRRKKADHVMTIATSYVLGASRSYPIMQLDLKENIQNLTRGKVYVRLTPGGQLGAGGALLQKTQTGTIQAAQHSLANFAPFAKAADLVNLPYFCGSNQRFVNLVTSQAWKTQVHPKIEAAGFKPLFYAVIDPRVVAVRKGGPGPVLAPDDLAGIKFRVPGSKMLQQYYRMAGANPTPVAWGETPSAIKQGVADALDPAVNALFVFGFKDVLSHVTFTRAVPDSQMYSLNLAWFNGLPADVKDGIMFAGEITFRQNLAKVPAARAYATAEMAKAGVEFHALSQEQLAIWEERAGYRRPEWDAYKLSLAGSAAAFEKLEEAAGTRGAYYVHDA